MEAQGGGVCGGEVRRLHIIYFLSRKGRSEHPHLIRVHHINRNGVHLRDVKRWLSELRGKDLPDSFAWSYKRKYKSGYVWQDLLDEDLITPISDNEYVLKGSEICSSPFTNDHGAKKASMQQEAPPLEVEPKEQKLSLKEATEVRPETPLLVSTKPSSEIEEESPPFSSEASTLTDDSMKAEEKKQRVKNKQDRMSEQNDKMENCSALYSILNRKNKKKAENLNSEKVIAPGSSTFCSSFTKSRSYSSGASNMFRNLISCGAIDTNDSAMVVLNHNGKSSNARSTKKPQDASEIFKGDLLGGSERIFGTPWDLQSQLSGRFSFDGTRSSTKSKKSELNVQKTISAAYKPINNPNCSQCGKQFKPEKLNTHMKSCKGMKALAKGACPTTFSGAGDDDRTPRKSTADSPYKDTISGYYLTSN